MSFESPEGWEIYNASACPLSSCDWSMTWDRSLNPAWVESKLEDHVGSHDVIEWVAEVVFLRAQMRRIQELIESHMKTE